MKKILVISHEASQTGAPILLLNYFKAIKRRHPGIRIDFVLGKGGNLVNEFQEIGRTLVMMNKLKKINFLFASVRKMVTIIYPEYFSFIRSRQLKNFIARDYDIIFSNSIVNGEILNLVHPWNVPVISYIHELEYSIRMLTSPETLANIFAYTTKFLVPGNMVLENLVKNHDIGKNAISVLRYYIPDISIDAGRKDQISKALNLDGYLVVGGMGSLGWRKGMDLFLQVFVQLRDISPEIKVKFLWIGLDKAPIENGTINFNDYRSVAYDASKSGIADHLITIESVKNPVDYLSLVDVFLLTSREDPYPVVVVEAAMQKKPAICFKDSGGAAEFIESYGGRAVAYLNTRDMAFELSLLLKSQDKRAELGAMAFAMYRQLHSEENSLPVLERMLDLN